MAKIILSKLTSPSEGPSQYGLQIVKFGHSFSPWTRSSAIAQGSGSNPSGEYILPNDTNIYKWNDNSSGEYILPNDTNIYKWNDNSSGEYILPNDTNIYKWNDNSSGEYILLNDTNIYIEKNKNLLRDIIPIYIDKIIVFQILYLT